MRKADSADLLTCDTGVCLLRNTNGQRITFYFQDSVYGIATVYKPSETTFFYI